MGHTNQTANYNLPQFVGTDKPSWLGDINDAFAAIDTAIAAAASEASTADGKADALTTTVSGHTTQIGTLQNTVTSQGNTLNTVTSLIGNGTPTTTDQTIIGAINELHADQGDLDDLQTTNKSSLVAAINEVAQGSGGGSTTPAATVTADGVKTRTALISELYNAIDASKLTEKSYILYRGEEIMRIAHLDRTAPVFVYVSTYSGSIYTHSITAKTTGSEFYAFTGTSGTNESTNVDNDGRTYSLYY